MLKHTTKRRSSVLEKNTKSGNTSHHSQTANEALRQKKKTNECSSTSSDAAMSTVRTSSNDYLKSFSEKVSDKEGGKNLL